MSLTLQGVDKFVGREMYLEGIDLSLKPGSRNVLLGRTLAGKTTLLRIMAGLDRPTRGKVLAGDRDVTGLTVRSRNVAMVYQQFISYPSLTVFNNIASPLKLARMDPKEIDRRVRETADILSLTPFLDRLPAELSGGQQQRTAVARALVKDSSGGFDGNAASLDFRHFRNRYFENAVTGFRRDAFGVGRFRQRKAAEETTARTFDALYAVVFAALFGTALT